ncbi:Ark- serine/threonine protein kinase [Coemansia sp. IMI 203386]|nr:Ark- serine/threonine protein kinase [Coemansia sp. IMI 203386]
MMASDFSRSWPSEHQGGFTQGTMLQVDGHSCVVQRFLSAGGHANLYLVTLMSDGTSRVLKHIQFADSDEFSRHSAQVNHEVAIMRQLSGHPQIVRLDAAEVTANGAYILMEYCPSDVLTLMNQTLPRYLDEQTILHIFTDTCKAVAHMHYQQHPLLHRDLKVENILISSAGYKLCDFGSATTNTIAPNARLPREQIVQLDEEIQATTTLEYRAPEMIDLYLQRGVTEKADIWALGVLLYKLCYFKTPFDNASPLTILNAEYSIPDKPVYSKQLRHVFQMTLREEPRERSTIYTLCMYLCGLRGEQCLLENKYASPPASPSESLASSKGGLGYVSAQPPAPVPRRYAASSTKYPGNATANADAYAGDAISEVDSGSIVPMRRGRPTRQHATTTSSSSPSNSRTASPVPRTHLGFSSRFNSSLTHSTRSVSESAPRSPPMSATQESNALGIFDSSGSIKSSVADDFGSIADPVPVGMEASSRDMRRMRMSVKAPDGRESLSVDFVQGAVFGSARRTSVLRRNPSVASNGSGRRAYRNDFGGSTDGTDDTLLSPAAGLSRKSTTSSLSFVSRTVSMGEYADETAMDSGLPGFVCQPLPPPPSQQQVFSDDAAAKPDPMVLADMISPLSLGHSSPTDDPWSTAKPTDDPSLLRLSTILESCQPDHSKTDLASAVDRRATNNKGIYEVTLDEFEDDARYSMVFDDQLMFNAKAQYAAQRSSVYQSPENYFDKHAMTDEAHTQWAGIAPETMDDLMRKMDAFSGGRTAMDVVDHDAWSTKGMGPRPTTAARPKGEEPPSVDFDTVLRRAEQRNRRKLIAQNNRRSQYIFNGGSTGASLPEVLQEDVDDGMRVLSEQEINELLLKMDMYNRELLSEQEKWGMLGNASREPANINNAVDLQSIEGMIEQANDQLLRSEQKSTNSSSGVAHIDNNEENKEANVVGGAKATAAGILQNVLSVAKSTFTKGAQTVSAAASAAAAAEPDTHGQECQVPAKPPRTFAQQADAVDTISKPEQETAKADEDKTSANSVSSSDDDTKNGVNGSSNSSSVLPNAVAPDVVSNVEKTATSISVPDQKPAESKATTTVVQTVKSATDDVSATASTTAASAAVVVATRPTTAPTKTTATALTTDSANPAVPKLPIMGRTHTDTPVVSDPLAEARLRLKKKQSTPLMRTTTTATALGGSSPVSSARAAFLGTLDNKTTPMPSSPKTPGGPAKKPAKSVRNLVAMFEQS